MFTLVVTLVVVVGSIVGVMVTVGVAYDQPATAGTLRHRASRPAPAVAPPVVVAPAKEHRLRSATMLVALTAVLGTLLAGGIGAVVVLLTLALQQAAG